MNLVASSRNEFAKGTDHSRFVCIESHRSIKFYKLIDKHIVTYSISAAF